MNNVSEASIAHSPNRKRQVPLGTGSGRIGHSCRMSAAEEGGRHSKIANQLQVISPEERWQAIAVMAYDLAKVGGFVGEAAEYWLAAEAKVDEQLAVQQSAM